MGRGSIGVTVFAAHSVNLPEGSAGALFSSSTAITTTLIAVLKAGDW